ncbi:Calnexin-like protein, partial [Colletotrichum sp. SAR 10_96]
MKITAVAAAALLAGSAYADDAQKVLSDDKASAASESATSVTPQIPTFTPTTLKAPFLEQFTDDWEQRWSPSHAKKDSKDEEEWAYVGEWAVEEPKVYKGMEGDKGLVVKNPAAHHAISAKFPKKIDNKGKTLVVQYEVKLQ